MPKDKLLDRNVILSLNKDPKSMDLHSMALARSRSAKVAPGSVHDFIEDRNREKEVGGMDEAFKTINTLAKNGTLDLWRKKFGHSYGMGHQKPIKESSQISAKIDNLLENVVASGVGAPIAPFGGGATSIENSYAKPKLTGAECTHQDQGASSKCEGGT